MNSGVHSSLHPNCHYQITHAKFNLKFFSPPPHERVVWHYQDDNNDLIQRFISQFNWERSFSNKGVNKQILIFNETILNIMTNFPNGTYLLKVNNKSTRTRCEICSKLTIKIPERRHWRRSATFIVNFEHISHLVLVFLLLTLNMQLPAGFFPMKPKS